MDILQSLQNTLDQFLEYIPQLIGAIIILLIGYIVARILKAVVSRLLQAVGFDGWMERGGIKQFFDRAQTRETPATVIGTLVLDRKSTRLNSSHANISYAVFCLKKKKNNE